MALDLLFPLLTTGVAATYAKLWLRERALARTERPSGQFVEVDGAKVHVWVEGAGPDLILIHGASGNLRDFTFGLTTTLAKRFRVICMDRPGFGFSDPLPSGEISLKAQALHLQKAAKLLGVQRPVLCGHSYGGAVSLAWALMDPPAALILISAPSLPWPGELDPWYRVTKTWVGRTFVVPIAAAWVTQSLVKRAIDGIFAPQSAPHGYGDHIGPFLSVRRKTLAINVAQVNALRDQLVAMEPGYLSLTIPVEMVHGTSDAIVPLAIHSAVLAPRLPSAHLTVLEGAGHMPHQTHTADAIATITRAAERAGLL